jgi:hypothetical protein
MASGAGEEEWQVAEKDRKVLNQGCDKEMFQIVTRCHQGTLMQIRAW